MSGPVAIVGAGPAGLSVARAHRAAGGGHELLLIGDEGRLPYQRPPLSKDYLRGDSGPDALPLEDAAWFAQHDVTRIDGHVEAVDLAARELRLAGGEVLSWSALVLATGSAPQRLPVPGAELPGVHVLRSWADSDALRAAATAGPSGPRRAVVVGSGFIGCEVAASLRALGCAVDLLTTEAVPQETRLGPEVGARLAAWLRADGVVLHPSTQVGAIAELGDGRLGVAPEDDGDVLACDLVVLGTGAAPRVALARDAGLALDDDGAAIRTDAQLRTSHPDVWAVGDIALADHPLAGRPVRVEHWGDALTQGEAVGRQLAGAGDARWDSVPGFWSTIGRRTLKYAAWGDGFDGVRVEDHGGGAFAAWFTRDGATVGVLAHERDEDYAHGRDLVAAGAPAP